jgi:hypothetical protein
MMSSDRKRTDENKGREGRGGLLVKTIAIFDPVVSPRNMAIVACRK